MAFITIPTADIAVGKPTKKSLWQKIKDNFDDHETRIAALSAGANKVVVFEYYVDPKDLQIGQIIPADMTLAEYQAVHGTGWVLCDGGSCTGSVYAALTSHTVVPDLQDEFLRGSSGTVTLGTAYSDTTAPNGLAVDSGGSHTHTIQASTGSGSQTGDVGGGNSAGVYSANAVNSGGAHTHTVSSTDSETAPQHFGVNFFIKINLSAQDQVVRTKAREALTITSVLGYIVDNNGLPTSGNMELDIKKGATIGALSTLYSTKPILAYSGGIADGDATSTGTVVDGTSYTIASGDWLQLDITSMMVGQSGIFIQVFGEVA
jgi:hypothetical protein